MGSGAKAAAAFGAEPHACLQRSFIKPATGSEGMDEEALAPLDVLLRAMRLRWEETRWTRRWRWPKRLRLTCMPSQRAAGGRLAGDHGGLQAG